MVVLEFMDFFNIDGIRIYTKMQKKVRDLTFLFYYLTLQLANVRGSLLFNKMYCKVNIDVLYIERPLDRNVTDLVEWPTNTFWTGKTF